MEKTQIITLNGKEYEIVLNRDSFARIDRVCDINSTMYMGTKPSYETLTEISDDYNPLEDINMDKIFETETKRLENLKKLIKMAFFILLYPKNQFKPSEVNEIINPYFETNEKIEEISTMTGELLQQCIELKDEAVKEFEEKNLKAQTKK